MDELFLNRMKENGKRFQHSLERIYDKYSMLDDEDGAMEVDLDNTRIETLERYMKQSKKKINKVATKQVFAESTQEASLLLDTTRNSQLDFTHEEQSVNGSLESMCQNEDEVSHNATCFTMNSLDESQRDFAYQPEDQDEQLEWSLQSQGSSLGDVYPNIINQLGKAWHRQHVSEAADSVRRRYCKWRNLSRSRTNLTTTFNTSLDKNMSRAVFIKEGIKSPVKTVTAPCTVTKTLSESPVKSVKDVLGLRTQHQYSPVRVRTPQRRESSASVLVMDLSTTSSQLDQTTLNKTFTMSKMTSPHKSRHYEYASVASPSKSSYPTMKTSQELYLRMKESCMSPRRVQAADCSAYTSENSLLTERPDVYGSPVRRSPYKAQLTSRDSYKEGEIYGSPVRPRQTPYKSQTCREGLGESTWGFVASPKSPYVHSYPWEPKRQNLVSTSLPSPKINLMQRTLEYSAPRPSSLQKMHSPQLATSRRQHGRRRHLSFDSSLPSARTSYTAKDLDEDFVKLYHKFVCMNKSFLQGNTCRLCAKSSDASRGHSFSNLAALALSPHRSVLRKRHGDLDGYPQSKRFKDSYLTHSPGSSRYKLMKRCLSPSAGAF